MAIDHAILVALSERTATGYDLARRFDASIGHFWKASHQQIYKVLARMDEQGWVKSEATKRGGRLDKKTYSITDDGRKELLRWTQTPSAPEVMRSDFAVKLRGFVDDEAIREDALSRLESYREMLAFYEESEKKFYPEPAKIKDSARGAYLALRGGILLAQGNIAWCEEVLAELNSERR